MLPSLRTYQALRVVLAVTLMLSAMLPLVQSACAMNGVAMTSMVGSEQRPMDDDCDRAAMTPPGSDEVDDCDRSPLCPEDAPCASMTQCVANPGVEASCCTESAVSTSETIVVEHMLALATILPLVASLVVQDANVSSPSPFSGLHDVATATDVPLRVLHASFLL